VQSLRALHQSGALDPLSEALLFRPTRPAEELYDWTRDRWQVKNLVDDPAHADVLVELRGRLDRWMAETRDHGPESDAMFQSDMQVYLDGRRGKGDGSATIELNIERMRQWAREGK
jgi:hypothetical protein